MSAVRWTRRRRAVQTLVAAFFVALPAAAATWGITAVAGTLAALRLGPVDVVEPAAAGSALLAAGTPGWTVLLGLLLGVAPLVVLALVAGPVLCSWVCPWGLISEGLDALRRRLSRTAAGRRLLPRRLRRAVTRWRPDAFRRLRRPRLALFAALLVLSFAAAVPLAALLSAPRLVTTLPVELVFLGIVSPVTLGLLAALLALELLGPRHLWCRALCPVGTTAKLLRTPRTLTVAWNEDLCTCPATPACQTLCPWGIDPRRMTPLDGCTNCFHCVETCPGHALTPAFGPSRHRAASTPPGVGEELVSSRNGPGCEPGPGLVPHGRRQAHPRGT